MVGILFFPFSSVIQYSPRANSLFVCLCKLPSRFSAPLKINWTLCKGSLKDSWEIYFICIFFISFPLNCSATLNTKISSLLEGRLFINDMFVTLLHFGIYKGAYYFTYFKPFKEPRNRFPIWRNRFLGIDCWGPSTFPMMIKYIGSCQGCGSG